MHTDLSAHLHSEGCNELIRMLNQCHQENPLLRFFGKCNSEDHQMVKCLKEERLLRRKQNYQKSLETKEKLQRLFREQKQKDASL
ncbi:unnamed protein product [Phaedon cochleariae]|uniref:COX assembly mitochondrial protein n=1 Tax=Phaedon cochleariae TaxID=80249 RepID=A0A9P0DKC3_PHACE|nr:unnamed protein product [Phaedon cochleariae]